MTNDLLTPLIANHYPATTLKKLLIPKRVAFAKENVLLNIHPKGYKKVKDHRRTHGEKGEVNEIQPDF